MTLFQYRLRFWFLTHYFTVITSVHVCAFTRNLNIKCTVAHCNSRVQRKTFSFRDIFRLIFVKRRNAVHFASCEKKWGKRKVNFNLGTSKMEDSTTNDILHPPVYHSDGFEQFSTIHFTNSFQFSRIFIALNDSFASSLSRVRKMVITG